MLGIIAQMEGDNNKALESFQRAVDLDPRAAIAANNLAWFYAERGEKLDYALQLAQTAVQIMPKAPEVQDTLGWVYYKRKTAEAAVQAFRQTIALAADNPTYHYHLGLAYLLAGPGPRPAGHRTCPGAGRPEGPVGGRSPTTPERDRLSSKVDPDAPSRLLSV